MPEARTQRRLAAILAADVVGYSRLIGADEAGTLAILRQVWAERFDPVVNAHGGRIVKRMGDGALVEFHSAVDAVEAAAAIQMAMERDVGGDRQAAPMRLRIGVELGDIVIDGNDIFGDGVNTAARLESRAPPGGVLVSDTVRAQIRGKTALNFVDAGLLELKNIDRPVRGWCWTLEGGPGGGDARPATAAHDPELPVDDRPSIAVLPFDDMSGDPDQVVFVDGLVEDIITTLSKLAGLRVIARNSTFVYKGRPVEIRDIANALDVRYVLEGSVRKSARRIRVTAQLIDARTGVHVWAERFDRTLEDVFAVQDEITLMLATEMQVRLTEGEQARLRYTTTTNVAAWTHWVEGLAHFRKPVTEINSAAALSSWRKALALDPDSAALHAMVGFKHYTDARFGWWDDRETALAKACHHADRALALDPDNPDAHITKGLVLLMQGAFAGAAEHARAAVRLAPNSADAASLACFILAFAGFPVEAVGHGERALQLAPFHPGYYLGILGNAYRFAGRTAEAAAAFEAYHTKAPGFGLVDLAIAEARAGRWQQARDAAGRLRLHRSDFTIDGWVRTQFRADRTELEADIAALRDLGLP